LTTPVMASEPYTAEPPPVTTSTRVIRICGRVLTSTLPPWFEAGRRIPSSRTRVRCWPKLRRLRKLPLLLPPPLLRLRSDALFWKTGSLFRPSARLVGVVVSNWSVLTTVSGVGELATSEMTREPVTTTDSTDSGVPPAAGADAGWAQAGQLNRPASSAMTDTVDFESRSMASPSVSQLLLCREMETAPCIVTSPEKPVP